MSMNGVGGNFNPYMVGMVPQNVIPMRKAEGHHKSHETKHEDGIFTTIGKTLFHGIVKPIEHAVEGIIEHPFQALAFAGLCLIPGVGEVALAAGAAYGTFKFAKGAVSAGVELLEHGASDKYYSKVEEAGDGGLMAAGSALGLKAKYGTGGALAAEDGTIGVLSEAEMAGIRNVAEIPKDATLGQKISLGAQNLKAKLYEPAKLGVRDLFGKVERVNAETGEVVNVNPWKAAGYKVKSLNPFKKGAEPAAAGEEGEALGFINRMKNKAKDWWNTGKEKVTDTVNQVKDKTRLAYEAKMAKPLQRDPLIAQDTETLLKQGISKSSEKELIAANKEFIQKGLNDRFVPKSIKEIISKQDLDKLPLDQLDSIARMIEIRREIALAEQLIGLEEGSGNIAPSTTREYLKEQLFARNLDPKEAVIFNGVIKEPLTVERFNVLKALLEKRTLENPSFKPTVSLEELTSQINQMYPGSANSTSSLLGKAQWMGYGILDNLNQYNGQIVPPLVWSTGIYGGSTPEHQTGHHPAQVVPFPGYNPYYPAQPGMNHEA